MALGQDVYYNAVYTAIAVRIRAFHSTLLGKHVHSRGQVLGSNPTTAKFLLKVFAARRRLLRNGPSKGHHSQYITLFLDGTCSVNSFHEVIRMSYAGLRDFLR